MPWMNPQTCSAENSGQILASTGTDDTAPDGPHALNMWGHHSPFSPGMADLTAKGHPAAGQLTEVRASRVTTPAWAVQSNELRSTVRCLSPERAILCRCGATGSTRRPGW